jgi:hypothetical protein
MSKHVVERYGKENRRLLAGIGIPLVGGFLLLLLLRLLHIQSASGDVFAYVVIALLAGAGSFLVARWWAIVIIPLLVLSGFLLSSILQGGYRDLLVVWLQRVGPLFLSVGLVGATLGVGVSRLERWQESILSGKRTGRPPLPASSGAPNISPLPIVRTEKREWEQETIPVPPPVPAPAPTVPEQDDIARVLAEMQREYAQAKPLSAQNDGKPKTL